MFKYFAIAMLGLTLCACASTPSTPTYSNLDKRLDAAAAGMAPMKVKDAEECFAAVDTMRTSFAAGDPDAAKGAKSLADLWYKKYMFTVFTEGSLDDKPKSREQIVADSVYGKAPTSEEMANPANLGESDAKKMINTKFCMDLGMKAIKAQ